MKMKKIAIFNILGSSNGRPNQSFSSKIPPYFIWVRETDRKRWVRWRRVKNFSTSDEKDQVYVLVVNSEGGTIVRFGDGKQGMIPSQGSDNIKATYRRGKGEEGKINSK
jgi:hypothetical protein